LGRAFPFCGVHPVTLLRFPLSILQRLKLPRGNPALIVLFIGGIVLPSLVLSVLSFRSIRNEVLIAERNYEDDADAFRKASQVQMQKEMQSLYSEVRRRSTWLYDQPRSIEDLSKAPPLDTIVGVRSIFLFSDDRRVFPTYQPQPEDVDPFPSLIPNAKNLRNVQSLALLRQLYAQGHFREAMILIDHLDHQAGMQGVLHSSLHEPLQWMRFRILVETGNRNEAIRYCLALVQAFIDHPAGHDLENTLFVFESMFSAILSFEELPSEQREMFWNLRRNLTFQMSSALAWEKNQSLLNHLLTIQYQQQDGLTFQMEDGEWGFRMSHPWLPGDLVVLAVVDHEALQYRLLKALDGTRREWKQVCFRLSDNQDSTLAEHLPSDTLIILKSTNVLEDFPGWTLTVYQRDLREVRKESRSKMFLLYSLVGFSLLVLILGSVFVTKGLAQERNLLAMKSNFLSSISHELKTPLTSIRMFSEMMAQGRVQKMEKVQEYSGLIGKEAARLDNLIQAILSYTRMERGQAVFRWEVLNFTDIAQRVVESLGPLAQNRGLEFHSALEPDLYIQGDHAALYSLVQNLVDNAIKYTPPPGTIQVDLKSDEQEVVLSVTDSGIGIPQTEQKHIFNDFYRVGDEMTRSTKGSGLGLAIVKRVIDSHRASINVQSRPGKGSTFTVRFKRSAHEQ